MWSAKVPKHAKNDFYCYTSTFNTFNDFLPPTPVDKVHAPPKVKSWIRHWYILCDFGCVDLFYFILKCLSVIIFSISKNMTQMLIGLIFYSNYIL